MTPSIIIVVVSALVALWVMAFSMLGAVGLLIMVVTYLRDILEREPRTPGDEPGT